MSESSTAPGRSIGLTTTSPSETLSVGRRLAALLRPGDVVLLVGTLGAGKTLLASGIAEGLGVEERVTSPTFVIVHAYEGFIPIYHADVYRLGSTAEFDDLDLPGMAEDGLLLIEWGDAVASAVPSDHLVVALDVFDDDVRTITFTPHGTWGARDLGALTA